MTPEQIIAAVYFSGVLLLVPTVIVLSGKEREDFDSTMLAVVFALVWPLVLVAAGGYAIFHGLYAFGEWLADRDERTVKEEPELPEARARRRTTR